MLRRAAVDPATPGLTVRLCRPADLLSWAGDGIGHSFRGSDSETRCPWHAAGTAGPPATQELKA
jgi:hypothetical protein